MTFLAIEVGVSCGTIEDGEKCIDGWKMEDEREVEPLSPSLSTTM